MVLVITVVVVFPLVKYQWYGIGGQLLQEILIGVITEKHFSIMFLCSSAVWDLNNNYRSWYLCEALVVCVSECCSWWLFSVAVSAEYFSIWNESFQLQTFSGALIAKPDKLKCAFICIIKSEESEWNLFQCRPSCPWEPSLY